MSSAPVAQLLPQSALLPEMPPRPWLAQVMFDTIGRVGARLGLFWIGIVATMAVFAPFIANSHPYFLETTDRQLVSRYGHFSSPLLQNLTGVDVTLLVAAISLIVLMFMQNTRPAQRAVVFFVLLLTVTPLSHMKPMTRFVHDLQRDWAGMPSHGFAMMSLFGLGIVLILDVVLLGVLLVRGGMSHMVRWVTCGVAALIGVSLLLFPVDPPALTNYAQYRQAQAAGRVQHVVRAPIQFSPSDRLRDQFVTGHPHPWAPQRGHWLGTEDHGEDILSGMIHACRIAMAIGFIATGIAVVIGVIVGGLMGYFVGTVDLIGMRIVEIFGSVPTLYLLLTFVALFGRNLYLMMVIIGFTSWVGDARFVRAEFLRLRNQDFVHAARAAGLPLRSILFRHMLPNAMAPLLVSASFGIASAILYESTLSFLGLGLVDEPSWGKLLNEAVSESGGFHWWLATFPGLAIFLTVFAYNLIGEAVRDALDPRLKGTD